LSGVNEEGTPINENTITKNLNKMVKRLGRPEDKFRLLAIYLYCYNLPKPDFTTIVGMLEDPVH
jgi:hypothetical protein